MGLCHIAGQTQRPALTFKPMAKDLDPLKLSSPRIFLFRMAVFVILGGLVLLLFCWRLFFPRSGDFAEEL